jgi:hypothetical protein
MNVKSNEEIIEELQTLEGGDYQTDYYPVSVEWLENILVLKDQAHKAEVEEAVRNIVHRAFEGGITFRQARDLNEVLVEYGINLTTPLPESDKQN